MSGLAEATIVEAARCGNVGLEDVNGEAWGMSCTPDPDVVTAPEDVGTFQYRSPRPSDPATLRVRGDLVDSELAALPATLGLIAR